MASTNKTTHYELSQYVGSDKPTYLVDYNGDMSKIDTGIYDADAKASLNATAIGTLSNLTTTAKSDLVSAINEVDGDLSGIGDLTTLTTSAKSNCVAAINEIDADVGLLSNLTTTAKTNVVAAINEVDAVADTVGDVTNLQTTVKSTTVGAINEVKANIDNFNLTVFNTITTANSGITSTGNTVGSQSYVTVAKNSDGSLAKIYGEIVINNPASPIINVVIANSGLTPSSEFTINCAGFCRIGTTNGQYLATSCDITIKTNGNIEISKNTGSVASQMIFWLQPFLYFVKDFGDVPVVD